IRCIKPLDAKDGLVRGALIGHESLTMTIDHQVKFFKHCHAKKNMLSEHHSGRLCGTSKHFYCKYLSEIDFLNTTISILCIRTPDTQESKALSDGSGNR